MYFLIVSALANCKIKVERMFGMVAVASNRAVREVLIEKLKLNKE